MGGVVFDDVVMGGWWCGCVVMRGVVVDDVVMGGGVVDDVAVWW